MCNKRGYKKEAVFEISNLVLAIIAFSFLVGLNIDRVSARDIAVYPYEDPGKELMSGGKAATIGGGSSTPNPSQAAGTPLGISDTLNGLLQDTLIGSLFWAGMISGGVALLSGMFGVSGDNQKALFMATFAAVMT